MILQSTLRPTAFAILLLAAIPPLFAAAPARAAIETRAREAILIDVQTGAVLLDKEADQSMPPASMSKIMTSFMVFERLKEGRLSLDDTLQVSEHAWRKGGSKMWVEVGSQVRIEDLLRGVIVQSGNDACIVLAEGLSGTEELFAEEMTERAHEIGLLDSTFMNSTGWPDPNHRTTARDLAKLAILTIEEHPEFYHYYSEKEFTWAGITQGNRNPLLYKALGADGLKTGHTEEAGYGLTASATRGDRRLVLVINGLPSVRARTEESVKLIQWGFREFDNYQLFKAGDTVEAAAVWLGSEETVPLVADGEVLVTLSRKGRKNMKVTVNYASPIASPIQEGQEIASLVVTPGDGAETIRLPLYAGASIERLGPFGRLYSAVKFMIFGAP